MTKNDIELLKKYRNEKSAISKDDMINVIHLSELGLIKIDDFYKNTVLNVTIHYAKTTEFGLSIIQKEERKEEENNTKKTKKNLFKKQI